MNLANLPTMFLRCFKFPAKCLNGAKVATTCGFQVNNRKYSTQTNDRDRLQDMRQGEKISLFTKSEFQNRISKLRKLMEALNMEATVLTSYHNINYFSGFLYSSFGRPYGLVVTHDKEVVLSAGIDGGQPWRRSLGASQNVTFTDWHRDNFFYGVAKELDKIPKGANVGIEFDNVTIERLEKFQKALKNVSLLDIGEPSMRMRLIKSKEEIHLITNGARVADIGGAATVETLREGVPEYEVALASTSAMVREIANTYPEAELMDTWTWFQSGPNTDGAHNPATTRQVLKGDILSINCFPMISGYYTALERTLFLDHASDAHLKYWEANCKVHEKGLKLIKPGVKCSDIAKELNECYREMDLLQYRSFGYGHSFGSLCHYYGREAALELREDIDTVLQPNMVVSMEPMIMIPEGQPGAGGYREHDILVLTEDGSTNITGFPYGPQHNIIKS